MILLGLEDSFDNNRAEEMLNLSVGRITHSSDLVRKSMYDFDLETPEGIEKLMALLPIMDPEILKDIMTEIWPGYPTDIDARRHRLEIKGYLKDYLESNDQEDDVESGAGNEEPGDGTAGPEDGESEEVVASGAGDGNLAVGDDAPGAVGGPQTPPEGGPVEQA